mmetsp:Transcript_8349/g.17007  ORF Transcript_8349/g.17007 Transcript_8349/m.17007 type:complete len:586 (+) Transcript_8349:78-1835(+)
MMPRLLVCISFLGAASRANSFTVGRTTRNSLRRLNVEVGASTDGTQKMITVDGEVDLHALVHDRPRDATACDLFTELGTYPVGAGRWEDFFRDLALNPCFRDSVWGQRPFKWRSPLDLAVGAFTIEDVAANVGNMPGQFTARGVDHQGGIYNMPFVDGFGFNELSDKMADSTVVMLNAGFCIPDIAAIAQAALTALQLPIWVNVYLTTPGLARSTQLHTDKQDVLLLQTSGRKRWRVYNLPPPSANPMLDPFARGKGTDHMACPEEDLLLDVVMKPGDVMYIPAGFPHVTDTANLGDEAGAQETQSGEEGGGGGGEPSVHLTVGVDTHLWGLSYATMRQVALKRRRLPATLASSGRVLNALPTASWRRLHESLPLGFLAAPVLEKAHAQPTSAVVVDAGSTAAELGGEEGAASTHPSRPSQRPLKSEAALCTFMAEELEQRMREAEPERWGALVHSLVEELDLVDVARQMLRHYRTVLRVQQRIHVDTMDGAHATASQRSGGDTLTRISPFMDNLDDAMTALLSGDKPLPPSNGSNKSASPSATAQQENSKETEYKQPGVAGKRGFSSASSNKKKSPSKAGSRKK